MMNAARTHVSMRRFRYAEHIDAGALATTPNIEAETVPTLADLAETHHREQFGRLLIAPLRKRHRIKAADGVFQRDIGVMPRMRFASIGVPDDFQPHAIRINEGKDLFVELPAFTLRRHTKLSQAVLPIAQRVFRNTKSRSRYHTCTWTPTMNECPWKECEDSSRRTSLIPKIKKI